MSKIPEYYNEYLSSPEGFAKFHNQVINMPRDKFSDISYEKIRSLANYFLTTEPFYDLTSGLNYKSLLGLLIENKKNGLLDNISYKNEEFEETYLRTDITLDELYDDKDKGGLGYGRMFRHLTEIMAFFGVIKPRSTYKRIIDFNSCREIAFSNDEVLISILRNNWLLDNVRTNGYIPYLRGLSEFNLDQNADYRPAYSIIEFLKQIDRPATLFEVSVLLGRIDRLQDERVILDRAVEISAELPDSQDSQIQYFFEKMGWHGFKYGNSQQPYFKFYPFLKYMECLDLIIINENLNTITLSDYSRSLFEDEIPIELIDLDGILNKVDDDNESDSELLDIIINKRSEQIKQIIQQNTPLVEKINKRALRPCNIQQDRRGKKKRNRLIAELAKLLADYTCQATNRRTFKMPNGKYYVEAHHLIEFSNENGPDITENLIILGPEKHRLIHLACKEEIEDLYNHLKTNGVINIERFKRMHTIYNCLTSQHIQILADKKLISSIDKEELLELIAQ